MKYKIGDKATLKVSFGTFDVTIDSIESPKSKWDYIVTTTSPNYPRLLCRESELSLPIYGPKTELEMLLTIVYD